MVPERETEVGRTKSHRFSSLFFSKDQVTGKTFNIKCGFPFYSILKIRKSTRKSDDRIFC